jgi:hypothetical protein
MTKTTSTTFDLDEVKLSSKVTVRRYREMEAAKDRNGLANFIEKRLLERYVDPLQTANKKHGFLMMASACLLIETLESFYRGWPDTDEPILRNDIEDACKPTDPGRNRVSCGEVAFCYFFQREPTFSTFRPYAHDFYVCVRCGILHQGETTRGWRIRRKGDLFDAANLIIDADKFLAVVKCAIGHYADELRRAKENWDDEIWENFRAKMKVIIEHCKP